jgi:hypothetical protein
MSNDTCLVMHPSSSEGIRDDMHDTTSESGSDRSEASKSSRQTNQLAPDVQSSCSSSPADASSLPQNTLVPCLRKVTDESVKATDESESRGPSGANDAQRPSTERRKRSYSSSPDLTNQADEKEEDIKTILQREKFDTKEDRKVVPQQEEWDTHDADFETSLISQRNRRVLMTRLYETAPRGRLSLVSTCARLFLGWESSRPRSYDFCFFQTLYSLILHEEESAWKMPSC